MARNKKGYIRTLEAIVAILMLYIFITFLLSQNKPEEAAAPLDIVLSQESVLKEIQSSSYYRNCVLEKDVDCVDQLASSTLGKKYDYALAICTRTECQIPATPVKEVYVDSIVISSNITKFETTSVNLYVWRKI